jgi:hypothetical protein
MAGRCGIKQTGTIACNYTAFGHPKTLAIQTSPLHHGCEMTNLLSR